MGTAVTGGSSEEGKEERVKGFIWEDIDTIKGHLRSSIETLLQ